MQMTPGQFARENLDALLEPPGWKLQNNADFNRNASEGVAVGEFQLPSGPRDSLLFIGSKAAGVIEAERAGIALSGVATLSRWVMATTITSSPISHT